MRGHKIKPQSSPRRYIGRDCKRMKSEAPSGLMAVYAAGCAIFAILGVLACFIELLRQ